MPPIPRNYTRLLGRAPAGVKREALGAAEESERFAVTITLRGRPDGPPVPDVSHYLMTPPSDRRRLTTQEFADRYGADPGDIDKLTAFLQNHGLVLDEVNPARRTIVTTGTVAEFSEAFAVELGQYEHEVALRRGEERRRETYRGSDGFIIYPALDGIIVGVSGLTTGASPAVHRPILPIPRRSPFPRSRSSTAPPTTSPPARQSRSCRKTATRWTTSTSQHHPSTTYPVPDPTRYRSWARKPGVRPLRGDDTDISIAGAAARGASIAVYFTTYDQAGWVDPFSGSSIRPWRSICSVLS